MSSNGVSKDSRHELATLGLSDRYTGRSVKQSRSTAQFLTTLLHFCRARNQATQIPSRPPEAGARKALRSDRSAQLRDALERRRSGGAAQALLELGGAEAHGGEAAGQRGRHGGGQQGAKLPVRLLRHRPLPVHLAHQVPLHVAVT